MMTLSDLTNVPSNDPHDTEANKRDADRPHYNINNQDLYDAERAPSERIPSLPPLMERCNSYTSNVSSDQDICRICHCEGDEEAPLIAPCLCAGSLRYVHQSCLQQWIKSSDTKCCELCKFNFIMHSKIKAFNKWEKLDMSGMERRKIACSVTFHVVAVTCVVWSLYVLIERTTVEVQEGHLEWPFWTKLIVVAIGFTGGLVFMYVQCKMYIQLCRRWRAFNRVIYVQNAPEKVPLSERERCDLQREAAQQCCGGGGGVKESCSESHESEKSLMGVLTGIRRPRTTPLNTGQNIQKPPVADTRSLPITAHQTFETPFIYEGRNSNYGSMEELSSHALVQNEVAPFRKSSSHSVCLEKGIEVNLVGTAPRHESQFEVRVHSHGSRIGTTLRRVETSEATIPETRMIHTPINLGLQRRTDSGSNASDVESLHLENM